MTQRNEPSVMVTIVELDNLRKDAERYRWLRAQHWDSSYMCLVVEPKAAVKLGHWCPFLEQADAVIDAAMAGEKP